MPNKLDPDKTVADKVLDMLLLLQDSNFAWTTSQLKERLNCSANTIGRMAESIRRRMGERFIIEKSGKENTYRLVPKASSRNNTELRYLHLCRDLAEPYLPKQILDSTERGLRRLEVFLGDESNEPRHNRPFAFLSKGYIDYTPHFATIALISDAIEDHSILELECKILGKKEREHHLFAPSVIAGMNGALYVLGVEVNHEDQSAGNISFFAIHRITRLNLKYLHCNFEMPKIEFEQYGLPWHEPRTYVIHFKAGKTAEWVQERVWSKNQSMQTLNNGDLELSLTTTAEPELLAWIRSFGPEAELVTQTEALVSTKVSSKKIGAASEFSNSRFQFGVPIVMVGAAAGVNADLARKDPEAYDATSDKTMLFKQACAQIKGEL